MRKNTLITVLLLVGLLVMAPWAQAQGIPMLNVSNAKGGQQYSLTLQLLALMTTLTLLPSMLVMMTSFVRIIIVLSLLRQALGTGQTPPNMVLVGLAMFLIIGLHGTLGAELAGEFGVHIAADQLLAAGADLKVALP